MKNNKNKKIINIIIVLIMIAIVIGIWFVQNNLKQEENTKISNNTLKFPLSVKSVEIDELVKNKLPIIIDLGADSCPPCKAMEPVLELLNKEMQEKAIIQFIDVWKYPRASIQFPVRVIPTQVFINSDGTPYIPSENIDNQIEFIKHTNLENKHIFTTHEGGLTEAQMRLILEDMGVK